MKCEVNYVKHNPLLEHYQVRVRFTDPDYVRGDMNPDDKEVNTICYTTFVVKSKDDIEKQIQIEAQTVWLRLNAEYEDEEITSKKEYQIDNETGEIIA